MNAPMLSAWQLIDRATEMDDALTIHLAVGRPPLVRIAERGLQPLGEDLPVMTWKSIQQLLSLAVEPERWMTIEAMGEGEVPLTPPGTGSPLRLVLFRNSEAWSAVIHLG